MSDEIKAAAQRWRAYQYFKHADVNHALHVAGRDARDLSDAYVDDQARREREQAERALPVTGEWLRSLGFTTSGESAAWLYRLSLLSVFGVSCGVGGGQWRYGAAPLPPMTNRGQLLDLLSALQVNTKGPDE